MRKISLLRSWSEDIEKNPLIGLYGVTTVTKSRAIGNIADLISDLDRMVEVGYPQYLNEMKAVFAELEDIIADSMHLRNLFVMDDETLANITEDERRAYVRRADLKVEIQFLETNEIYMNKLVDIIRKINRFNDVKNERVYSPKVLKKYSHVMDDNNV